MTQNCNWLIRIVEEKRRQLIQAARARCLTTEEATLATIRFKQMTGREVERAYQDMNTRRDP